MLLERKHGGIISVATKTCKQLVWTLYDIYFILLYKNPGLVSWAKRKSILTCGWRQINSVPIWTPFVVTPIQGTEGPDL